MALLDQTALRERIERLAAIDRPSASPGEAEAAGLIASEMAELGIPVRLEEEPAHGTYWWPVGLMCAAATVAGFRRRRALPALVAAAAAAGVVDDISGGKLWFRRTFLPQKTTTNVIGEVGPADTERTVVVVSHHDAAHSGLVFHPEASRAPLRRYPHLKEKDSPAPVMWGAFGGPAAVALGALAGSRVVRVLGGLMSLGYTLAMADIGSRKVVAGANDNLSAVGVVLSLAHSLHDDPIDDVRVILLSTGSEESFMEGMQGFARTHFGELSPERTTFICLDSVGSPHLLPVLGEGMVWMNEYPKGLIAEAAAAARETGVELGRGLHLRAATDGLISLRAGYPTVTIGSVDEFNMPTNYHWPTDTPGNLHYDTVEDCARLCRRLIERLAVRPLATASPSA